MKKSLLILALFISFFATAQKTLNDYKYVIVPVKYDTFDEENKYRLNTITKQNLLRVGFEVFYDNQDLPVEAHDRCSKLYVSLENKSGVFITELAIVFKDCDNKIVYKSEFGKSRNKQFKVAYPEALNEAFASLYIFGYKYNESSKNGDTKIVSVSKPNAPISSPKIEETDDYLFAQPIKNGYQLVDKTPKIVLKIYKTSQPDYFTAQSETINGAVIKKNGEWILEYYKDDKPVSEKLLIKF